MHPIHPPAHSAPHDSAGTLSREMLTGDPWGPWLHSDRCDFQVMAAHHLMSAWHSVR